MIKSIEYIIKHNAKLQAIYKWFFSLLFKTVGLFVKVNDRQILFFSMSGRSFGDSTRVLYDYIVKDPFFEGYKLIWAFEEPEKFSRYGLNTVKLNSFSYFTTALRSKFWITNTSMERGLSFKPKKTVFLNTWHGVPLKVIGNGYKNRNDYDFSDVDFMCYSGEYEKDIYVKGFNVQLNNLVMCGLPRNDILYLADESVKEEFKKKYHIPEGKTVILYAPTFRDVGKNSVDAALEIPIDFKKWEKKLGDNYIVLCRMHYHTTELLGVEYNDFVIDCTGVENISDLYIISDILISDYSSSMIDYSILEKPIISYAYDKEEYAKNEGFFVPLDEALPGMVFENEDQMLDHITSMDINEETKKSRYVKNKYIQSKGNATVECINYLKSKA